MSFNLIIRGQTLSVAMDQKEEVVTYLVSEGAGLTIEHQGTEVALQPGVPVTKRVDTSVWRSSALLARPKEAD